MGEIAKLDVKEYRKVDKNRTTKEHFKVVSVNQIHTLPHRQILPMSLPNSTPIAVEAHTRIKMAIVVTIPSRGLVRGTTTPPRRRGDSSNN